MQELVLMPGVAVFLLDNAFFGRREVRIQLAFLGSEGLQALFTFGGLFLFVFQILLENGRRARRMGRLFEQDGAACRKKDQDRA